VPEGSALRILIVDDEADNTDLLALLLEAWGHECERAYTGADALELIPIFKPALILLDIGLPDLDGCRVASLVRERHGESIYIAAITGWGKDSDRDRALAAGINEHLAKPVERPTLIDLLDRAARH
jgi:CheY-like chemotaxis protein